jgi:hypothetical protein
MSTSQSIHPLGYGDTDQIDPVVADSLTTYQVEWLSRQCQDLGFKKLQILRQALFEWVDETSGLSIFRQHFWVRNACCPGKLYESA